MRVAKKVFFIVLMIWLILAVKVTAQTATAEVTLVLREGASTSTEPIAEVKKGETVEIVEKSDNWYKVNYNDQTGFIRADLLDVQEEQTEETQQDNQEQQENNEEKIQEDDTAKEEDNQQKIQEEPTQEANEEVTDIDQEYIEYKDTEKKEQKQEEKKIPNSLGEKQIVSDTVGRIVPSLSASKLGIINAGTKVTVVRVLNSWSLIKYDENKTAWVPTKLLKEIEQEETKTDAETETELEPEPSTWTGYINVSAAIIRGGASTSSDIITEIYRNNAVEVIGEEGDWYKILHDGQEAYIAKRLVSTTITAESASRNLAERNQIEEQILAEEQDVEDVQENIESSNTETYEETSDEETITKVAEENVSESQEEEEQEIVEEKNQEVEITAPASLRGDEVVEEAKKYLGCSYVYGGAGPSSFDCSGFTMYIYGKFGISLAHGATSQANSGTYVSKDSLQPGDLVIFRDWENSSIGHCGIYIGGGRFIHAANPRRGVVTDTLNSGYYYERYVSGRRLV